MRTRVFAWILVLLTIPLAGQTVSGRAPSVVWKRDMSVQLQVQPSKIADPLANVLPAIPALMRWNTPVTRTEARRELSSIHEGSARAEVFAVLGQPAYSIAMADNGHYVERCRFRAGVDYLTTIEFRDGRVSRIDKSVP